MSKDKDQDNDYLHIDDEHIDGDHHCHHDENLIFAKATYILYLISVAFAGMTGIIGVVIAYIHDKEGPDWLDTHYRFQIRTFWIGLLYAFLSFITAPILIGFLGFFLTAMWYIIRSVKGLKRLVNHQEYPNCTTWTW